MAGSQSPRWPDRPTADRPPRSSIISNIANIIATATQSASDEFDRLRESIGLWTREEPHSHRSLQSALVQERYPELLHNRVIPDPLQSRERSGLSQGKARKSVKRSRDEYLAEDNGSTVEMGGREHAEQAESGSEDMFLTPPEDLGEKFSFLPTTSGVQGRKTSEDSAFGNPVAKQPITPDLAYRYHESLQLEAERVAKLERDVQSIKEQMADLVASSPSASSTRSVRTVRFSPLPKHPETPPPPPPPSSSLPPNSPVPRPPPSGSLLLRPRSTDKAKVTKPNVRISAHGLAGAQKVLPSSPFVRTAFQQPSRAPDDKHRDSMREIIGQIPNVKLRRTDIIRYPDGTSKPNPFWDEIYNRSKRLRRPASETIDIDSKPSELSSSPPLPSKRARPNPNSEG